ncbi:MAG: ATP-grasp domain-containing protein, partial [Clostridia bacterium]|nr:ATP-grasp domain-containing protein [Clostridia bacterium]
MDKSLTLLVVGSGGREHALIKKLRSQGHTGVIYCLPGNGGMANDAVCFPVGATDIDGIVGFAAEKKVGFAIVTPDDPLALGAVDRLTAAGVPCFGPEKKAAEIESSKVFAKDLMKKYGIPTASYEVFDDAGEALAYLETAKIPTVVKADGLALGKGVTVAFTREEAQAAVRSVMEDRVFGESGSKIVIEEYLEGPEVSVLSFTDGKVIKPMVSSMDHKRAYDGNRGPNTGGMGT